jgi:signal transduction histidine kinase
LLGLALVLLLLNWAFLEDIEALAFDFCLRLRGEQPPDPRIVIVAVDDYSLAEVAPWPWPPEVLGRLFSQILAAEPRLVGIDLILTHPLHDYLPPGAGPIVLADALRRVKGWEAVWQAPSPDSDFPGISLAHIHAAKDADGACRSIPLAVSADGIRRWAFSVELARRYLEVPSEAVFYRGRTLELGNLAIPRLSAPVDHSVDAAGILASLPADLLLLNSRGGPGTFPALPAAEVLSGKLSEQMRGRIVLVGATAYSLGDHLGTAFSGYSEMPGIEIHANALDTILNRRFLTAAEEPWRSGLMLASMMLAWGLLAWWPPARRLWAFSAFLAGGAVLLAGSFLYLQHWLGLVAPLVAAVLAGASSQFLRYAEMNRRLNQRFAELSELLRDVLPHNPMSSASQAGSSLEWKIELLGDAAEAALRLSRERAETAAFVTHELKTPLTSIQGFAELLQLDSGLDPEDRRDAARYIESESRRLAAMVHDYLRLARLEQRGAGPWTEFDLGQVVRRAAETAAVPARSKAISVAVEVPADQQFTARGDPGLIQQVFVNLVENAVKFSAAGSRVTLDVTREGTWLVGRVSDQGCGIPAEHLGRVFDKFFRSSAGDGQTPPGSGLGLAFVRQVVELHGGAVGVESEVGVGSVFTVRLPSRPD